MKILLGLCLLFCLENKFTTGREFNEKWNGVYSKIIKNILQNGLPDMGIAKIDPFQVNKTFCFETGLNIFNVNLVGLFSNFSDVYINNLKISSDLQSTLELQFTALNFNGNYNLSGQIIKAIPLEGRGNIKLFLGNVILLVEGKIHGNNRIIQVSNFTFSYDLGVSRIVITGLFEQYHLDNIIEHFLSDLIPSGLNLLRYQIETLIDQMTLKYGNAWLKGMDLKHIIEAAKHILIPHISGYINY